MRLRGGNSVLNSLRMPQPGEPSFIRHVANLVTSYEESTGVVVKKAKKIRWRASSDSVASASLVVWVGCAVVSSRPLPLAGPQRRGLLVVPAGGKGLVTPADFFSSRISCLPWPGFAAALRWCEGRRFCDPGSGNNKQDRAGPTDDDRRLLESINHDH